MSNYILSKKASDDLAKIWNYTIETWSERQADTYFQNIIQAIEYIANNSHSAGRSYDDVRLGCRGFRIGRHIIFYRTLTSGKIRIIRILHEKMDFGRHL